ncbi:UNVERIFIED_CONTAM: hypothetical protein K2H54_045564 [Gekko kuhli]
MPGMLSHLAMRCRDGELAGAHACLAGPRRAPAPPSVGKQGCGLTPSGYGNRQAAPGDGRTGARVAHSRHHGMELACSGGSGAGRWRRARAWLAPTRGNPWLAPPVSSAADPGSSDGVAEGTARSPTEHGSSGTPALPQRWPQGAPSAGQMPHEDCILSY